MGRYITFNDVTFKYGNSTRVASGTAVDSNAHLEASEREVESTLSSVFTVPFSSNNITVKDLMIDLTYSNLSILKDDKAKLIRDNVYKRMEEIKNGSMPVITSSGEALFSNGKAVWSETENYQPVFDKGDILDQGLDIDQLEDLEDSKDWNF